MKLKNITKPSTAASKAGWTYIPLLRSSISARVGGVMNKNYV
ncbi:hypothetical protein [Microbulbifer sp. PAAF003]